MSLLIECIHFIIYIFEYTHRYLWIRRMEAKIAVLDKHFLVLANAKCRRDHQRRNKFCVTFFLKNYLWWLTVSCWMISFISPSQWIQINICQWFMNHFGFQLDYLSDTVFLHIAKYSCNDENGLKKDQLRVYGSIIGNYDIVNGKWDRTF